MDMTQEALQEIISKIDRLQGEMSKMSGSEEVEGEEGAIEGVEMPEGEAEGFPMPPMEGEAEEETAESPEFGAKEPAGEEEEEPNGMSKLDAIFNKAKTR